MRLLAWNVNHRTRAKLIPPALTAGIISLLPDVVILTEYVGAPSRDAFPADLAAAGLSHHLQTPITPGHNQVLFVSRSPMKAGSIYAPAIAPAMPSNVLHVEFPELGIEVLGMRLPDYSKDLNVKRACWDWILETAAAYKDRPFVIIGDLNTDSKYSPASCGDRIGRLTESGWQHAQPVECGSFWTLQGLAVRIDHAFVSQHFAISDARFITEFNGTRFIGSSAAALSDHAALLIDLKLSC